MTTHTITTAPARSGRALLAAALVLVGACSSDALNLPNVNSVTPAGAASNPRQGIQLSADGIFAQLRASAGGYNRDLALFGREAWYFQLQDSRWTTGYFRDFIDNTSFATGNWGGRFANLRNLASFQSTVDQSTLTPAQRAGATGVRQTIEALEYLYLINTRDSIGVPIGVDLNDFQRLFPFVTRDSAFNYIANTLDAGYASLTTAGAEISFSLPVSGQAGFAGFTTPATFAQFNRALKARVEVYRATLLGRSASWAAANTALSQSFIQGTLTAGTLNTGPSHIYSTAAGDALNPFATTLAPDLYANMTITTDAGIPPADTRITSKLLTGQGSRSQAGSDASTIRFSVWPSNTSQIAIIDHEELWLLQAEIQANTGNLAGATTTLNTVAQVAGGQVGNRYTTFATVAAFNTALLAERRMSLLLEGHRWIDVRRINGAVANYGLPLGGTGFVVARRQVLPQLECQTRDLAGSAALRGPGCP
jgi:starch-binding outer membrane protein, SusD/RagB family